MKLIIIFCPTLSKSEYITFSPSPSSSTSSYSIMKQNELNYSSSSSLNLIFRKFENSSLSPSQNVVDVSIISSKMENNNSNNDNKSNPFSGRLMNRLINNINPGSFNNMYFVDILLVVNRCPSAQKEAMNRCELYARNVWNVEDIDFVCS